MNETRDQHFFWPFFDHRFSYKKEVFRNIHNNMLKCNQIYDNICVPSKQYYTCVFYRENNNFSSTILYSVDCCRKITSKFLFIVTNMLIG